MQHKSNQQKLSWSRLDNAAKIFPSTSVKTDTRVFRFSCELKEIVDKDILQQSTEYALEEFPHFQSVMKKGFFWYYLEQTDLMPVVELENQVICPPIYDEYKTNLLFKVSYFKQRINLEMYHSLTDGTGALQFLKSILYYYLTTKHKDKLSSMPIPDFNASFSQKKADSFRKYYQKPPKSKSKKIRAYSLKMERRNSWSLQVIDGLVSVKNMLALAKSFNTTLTAFLASVLIESIYKEMPVQSKIYPISLMIPVNLRQFFPSETTTNFFGTIEVNYNFKKNSPELVDIIKEIDKQFKQQLTKDQMAIRMNNYSAIEHNPFIRLVPLNLKDFFISNARKNIDKATTTVLSNVGKVTMPQELCPYIHSFGVYTSTLKMQLCACSFQDNLQLGFTCAFLGTDIQKNFFRTLTSYGIDVELRCNDFYSEEV